MLLCTLYYLPAYRASLCSSIKGIYYHKNAPLCISFCCLQQSRKCFENTELRIFVVYENHLPRNPFLFHIIRSCDVIIPDIILPFLQPNQPTKNITSVNTNPHIHINECRLTNSPTEEIEMNIWYITFLYLIPSIMARPMLTMLMAWFGLETGRPDTQ